MEFKLSLKDRPKVIELDNDEYIIRWSPWSLIGYSLKIHAILRSDAIRDLHDHPWWFISFILLGSYTEILPNGQSRIRKAPCLIFHRATDAHRIVLHQGPVISIIICGRKSRQWGFYLNSCEKGDCSDWIECDKYIYNQSIKCKVTDKECTSELDHEI